jgi:hypothetical protein
MPTPSRVSGSTLNKTSANSKNSNPFNKILSVLKKQPLMIMLAAMPIAGFTGCDKDEPEPLQQTVEYTFGPESWDEIYPASKLSKVGADKNIKTIKIKSDGEYWGGLGSNSVLLILDPAFEAANGKGTGDGTKIYGLTIKSIEDSLKLVKYGYLVNVR